MRKIGRYGGMTKKQVKNRLCELREAIKPLQKGIPAGKRDKLCEEAKALHERHSDWLLIDLSWVLCETVKGEVI